MSRLRGAACAGHISPRLSCSANNPVPPLEFAAKFSAVLLLLALPSMGRAQASVPDTAMTAAAVATTVSDTSGDATARMRWYYHQPNARYGSAALRSPVETFLTRGFSNLVLESQERALHRIDWEKGWRSVTAGLTHPAAAIERFGGLDTWLHSEFLPDGGRVWQWAWAPNYGGHIVAGGITYRYFAEWLDDKGAPMPRVTAAAAYMLDMFVNEMIEAQVSDATGQASAVADLLFFDPVGIAVFSFDAPARFFAETLEAADWSPQVAYTLPLGRLENSSQNMSYKVPIPFTGDHVRILLLIGMGAASGLQVRLNNGLRGGGALGFDATRRYVDPKTGAEYIHADWQGGFYLDRNNSLLASLAFSERYHSRWQVNVYPGVLPRPLHDTGFYAVGDRDNRWSFGLSFRRTYGVGLGWNNVKP